MRVGLLGGGVIARLFLEHARRGEMGDAKVVALAGRNENSRGNALAREFGVPFVVGAAKLIEARPEVAHELAGAIARRQAAGLTVGPAEVDEGVPPHRLTNWFTARLHRLYDISKAA